MARSPKSFNQVATLYDKARPPYPVELIDDLFAMTGISSSNQVLEIGAGTGQITVPLAKRGLHITSLELGSNLAEIARKNLRTYPDVQVIVTRFEDYKLLKEKFSLVVSATAFHWLDPEIRVKKSAEALKPGGHIAIIHTRWGVGKDQDEFSKKSQTCYERWDPDAEPGFVPPSIAEVSGERPELDESPYFKSVEYRQYEQRNNYTTSSYLDLLRTFSNINAMAKTAREGLLSGIGQLIDGEFEGKLTRSDLRELWVAKRV